MCAPLKPADITQSLGKAHSSLLTTLVLIAGGWSRVQGEGQPCLVYNPASEQFSLYTEHRATGKCEYGSLPGTMEDRGLHKWKLYDEGCQLVELLPPILGLKDSTGEGDWAKPEDVSMLLLGDSVEREMLVDINETTRSVNSKLRPTLLNEHWRAALKLPHLEMVYQFAPGSHMVGPYHDDVPWNMTIANALPRAFELHQILTGRAFPNVVVFSNILWDLGRWFFLSEIAEPERREHFGKPLLREQEYLPPELLTEWKEDTELQMRRIEERVEGDTVLIYHNAAFALLEDCKKGTDHASKGTGKRTHFVQLNALARQILAEKPRWHLVDLGQMSESFLAAGHLRDSHHPNRDFMLQVMNIYLNLHRQHGYAPRTAQQPARHAIFSPADSVRRWDQQYLESTASMQSAYLADAEVTQERLPLERQDRQQKQQEMRRQRKERVSQVRKVFMNLSFG